MPARQTIKAELGPSCCVGVIYSRIDLLRAIKMRFRPDLFELRLDALAPVIDEVERVVVRLRAPLIITARHPREGGTNALSVSERRNLLLRFLPHAAYLDVELRSARSLAAVLDAALATNVRRIISYHDFEKTPSASVLRGKLLDARKLKADIFKIATRIETASDRACLIKFFEDARELIPIAAMGIGKLGRAARITLAQRGSILNYGYLDQPQAQGQLSLAELRVALAAVKAQ